MRDCKGHREDTHLKGWGTQTSGPSFCILVLGFVWVLFTGCDTYPPSEPFEFSEIPGRYEPTFGDWEEYILLNRDSTFVHWFKSNNGIERLEEGRWSLRERGPAGYYTMSLKGYHKWFPTAGGSYHPYGEIDTVTSMNCFTYKKRRGKMELIWHPIDNERYVKVWPAGTEP